MIYVLTAEQMRAADAAAIATLGESQLMRNAGARIAECLKGEPVVAFAGPGNNGGDAFAALASVRERDPSAQGTIYAEKSARISDARRDAEARASAAGVQVRPFPKNYDEARLAMEHASIVLDALFGTGSRLPIAEPYASVIRAMNGATASIMAIDIPSGIDADSGAVSEPCVKATTTIALAALKPGLLLQPARGCVGWLSLADIGVSNELLAAQNPRYAALDDDEFLDLLPKRPPNSDKRASGAPMIIAGSQQFPGAAILCAMAAARAGAGYVTVATSSNTAPILRGRLIEQVVTEISEDAPVGDVVEQLLDTSRHCSAVGIGPGLALDARTGEIVRGFLRKCALPFVADASALFHFAKHLDLLDTPRAVITPHVREFARLDGKGTIKEGERIDRLREFVERTHCTTLLKGRTTLVYDGTIMHMNTTGTAVLATAGTGDVLTGIIATLLSQGLSPIDAARAGAYWHGLAGQYCARIRHRGVIAGDLPEALAPAIPYATERGATIKIF